MAYRKKYEDTYLDDELDEFDGDDKTDGERIVTLLEKPDRTPLDNAKIAKLTERLLVGAKLPGIPGDQAIYGIEMVAKAYVDLGTPDPAVALWEKLMVIATATSRSELYYKAMDEMATLSEETYEEHHGNTNTAGGAD